MKKVFEDRFMEIQSSLISLCLEITSGNVDKVFAYASIERYGTMFNAFFMKDKEIITLNQLGIDKGLMVQFLKIGTQDLQKLREICKEYDMKTPTELKMYYDVKSGKYDADYRYEEICSSSTGVSAGEVFMEWYNAEKYRINET